MPSLGYRFDQPLREGIVLSRPNRFVMIVKSNGHISKCHCPTTGRLGDLDLRGIPCLLSKAKGRGRKTEFTVEAISVDRPAMGNKSWIGINQTAVNAYVEHSLRTGQLSKMVTGEVKREVKLGRSRIDFSVGDSYLEVKTPLITLPSPNGARRVSRGRFNSFDRLIKHMNELGRPLRVGKKAILAMCYLYDAKPFRPPARNKYNAKILQVARRAARSGVQTWQLNFKVDRIGVSLLKYFRNRLFT